ncbi:sodium:calcium antiporter [bacterium]|nr:sodium:calcium antiporter [bacterium]
MIDIMSIALSISVILVSAVILSKSVKLFIGSTSRIAYYFNISEYTIGFLLVALATSLPEMVVGITSAAQKQTVLSFGDAMGSNIALLTIVLALPGLLGMNISTKQIIKSSDIYYTAVFSLLALGLSFDGKISRIDGVVLLVGYLIYTLAFLRRATPIKKLTRRKGKINIWKEVVLFVFSLSLLLLASEGIVGSALSISTLWGLKLSYVGLSITALGTSIPEIAFVIGETRERNDDEIMGDIVGSVVANSTLVLGVASVIYPVYTNGPLISISTSIALVIILTLFLIFAKTGRRIEKWESVILLFLYFAFILSEYFVQKLY